MQRPVLVPDTDARPRPDAHWRLADAARCSLWWTHTPPHEQHRVGIIGHFAARDSASAATILGHACEQLAAHGCTIAIGPMDGNTWQNYRLVTERGSEPPFFLEPDHPPAYVDYFADAGFTPLAHYYSALNDDLGQDDPDADAIADRLHAEGIAVRPIDVSRLEDELRRIHALSLESFRGNFLFSPIGVDEFLAQYLPLRPFVNPALVLVAQQGEATVGYLFAVPDLLQQQRGQRIDTFIIKTLASHPALRGSGLGRLLAARCHQAARRLGFRRAIHALMEESSKARDISGHLARPMRRYALFARPLGAAR